MPTSCAGRSGTSRNEEAVDGHPAWAVASEGVAAPFSHLRVVAQARFHNVDPLASEVAELGEVPLAQAPQVPLGDKARPVHLDGLAPLGRDRDLADHERVLLDGRGTVDGEGRR